MKQDRINEYPIPKTMKAWVLGDREELTLVEKPVPEPGSAEVLVRVDAIAIIPGSPCSGAPNALNEAARMVNRGGRICLAAFPAVPVPVDLAHLVRNNIYVFGIRGEGKSATHRAAALMAQKRFDAKLIHTHTFPLGEVPTAIRYARERIEDAIKVVVQIREN